MTLDTSNQIYVLEEEGKQHYGWLIIKERYSHACKLTAGGIYEIQGCQHSAVVTTQLLQHSLNRIWH